MKRDRGTLGLCFRVRIAGVVILVVIRQVPQRVSAREKAEQEAFDLVLLPGIKEAARAPRRRLCQSLNLRHELFHLR
jgi:hypothetical protein